MGRRMLSNSAFKIYSYFVPGFSFCLCNLKIFLLVFNFSVCCVYLKLFESSLVESCCINQTTPRLYALRSNSTKDVFPAPREALPRRDVCITKMPICPSTATVLTPLTPPAAWLQPAVVGHRCTERLPGVSERWSTTVRDGGAENEHEGFSGDTG